MPLLDRIPGDQELYIGGLFTVRRKQALQEAGITHILSVLRLPLDPKLFEDFTHYAVEVDDVDDENLLEHFPACNAFIQKGLDAGGGVLVHCAMGKSRSATVSCAYLMYTDSMTPTDALGRIRESRPFCEPNDGFMKQLHLYFEMGCPTDIEQAPAYQRWLYLREVELSRACGQAPEAEKIRFEDEHAPESASAEFDLRCKKCRRTLATSQYLVGHQARGTKPDKAASSLLSSSSTSSAPQQVSPACSHYFVDPLSWMRPELELGKLDGRLECPKCKTLVGKYAWQGMQCSCGDWVVPGISLAKGKVDEARSKTSSRSAGMGMGIRMPPPLVSNNANNPKENL